MSQENIEQNLLIARFEEMLRKKSEYFFDSEEFETVIDFYIDKNQLITAGQVADLASRQHPFSAIFPIRKAQLLSALNETQAALEVLTQAENLEPSNPELFMTRGGVYSQMGLSEKAIANFKMALDHSEDRDQVYLNIAYEYENISKYADAIFFLKKALSDNSDNEAAVYELAFCYELNGQHEESVLFFNQFIDKEPYSHAAWFNLGVAYNRLSLYEKILHLPISTKPIPMQIWICWPKP
jgi:tetratricopeptide (TPR) repeat protein